MISASVDEVFISIKGVLALPGPPVKGFLPGVDVVTLGARALTSTALGHEWAGSFFHLVMQQVATETRIAYERRLAEQVS